MALGWIILNGLLATAAAFAPLPLSTTQLSPATTTLSLLLNDAETKAILKSAEECAASECTVEDVSIFLSDLQAQETLLQHRLKQVRSMTRQLERLNGQSEHTVAAPNDNRDRDEVRQLVKDMLRVFAHEKTAFPATGFSGDIGKGPQTAYDALPPKRWKASP